MYVGGVGMDLGFDYAFSLCNLKEQLWIKYEQVIKSKKQYLYMCCYLKPISPPASTHSE